MAYFISDQDSKKGKDPDIHIIDGIDNIKERTYVNVFISNDINKHVTFNKGELCRTSGTAYISYATDLQEDSEITYSSQYYHRKG